MNLSLPPTCSGGVFEYAAKYALQDNNWIGLFIQCSFQQPTTIALLFILFASFPPLMIGCYFWLRRCSNCPSHINKLVFHRSRPKSPLISGTDSMVKMAVNNKADTISHLLRSDLKFIYQLRRPLVDFRSTQLLNVFRSQRSFTWSYELRGPDTSIEDKEYAPPVDIQLSLATLPINLEDTDSANMQTVASSTSSSPLSIFNDTRSHRYRVPRCSSKKTAFTINLTLIGFCLLLAATVYTCYTGRQVEMTITSFPNYMKSLSFSAKRLTNTWISEAYELIVGVIRDDVNKKKGSRLRPFIEQMKLSFGKQAMRMYATVKNSTRFDVENATRIKLSELETLLKRLSTLISVAPLLSTENIKKTQKSFFLYTYELSRFSPQPLFLLNNVNITNAWRDNDLLKRTSEILCKNPTKYFKSCLELEQQLSLISQQATILPQLHMDGDLGKVTAYMFVPKLLNAEDYVQKWLPVAQDPPGSIPFLFDELVIPEIDKGRFHVNQTLDKLRHIFNGPPKIYLNYVAKSPGVLVGFLTFFVCAFFAALMFSLKCRCNNRGQRFKTPSADNRTKMPLYMTICFCLLAVFATVFCFLGVTLALIGSVGENQVCVYLFNGKKQHDADKFLFQLTTTLVSKMPALEGVRNINNINLNLPYPLLTTIDSVYSKSSKPLLTALNINRPANLTAVLFSSWLNETLYKVWYNETWPLMISENLAEKIPKIQLIEVFAKVRTSMKLDQTFDKLHVGNASYYLPKPAIDHYTTVANALQSVSQDRAEATKLADYYAAIGHLINKYKTNFDKVDQALNSVRANRGILAALEPLIQFGSVIIDYLGSKTTLQLTTLFTNLTAEIWLDSRIPISEHIIPIAHSMLDLLLLYPSLRPTYRFALSPICSPVQGTASSTAPLFQTLVNFGFGLALSSLLLLLFCIIRLMR